MLKPGTHQILPIAKVELDKTNPRINLWTAMYSNPNQAAIKMALGVGGDSGNDSGVTYTSLRESIRTHGGIIHPIIVNKKANGTYVAIEGNTRLAIYLQFNQEKIPGDWANIPSIVYDNLEQEEIDAIRLQAHLVGPRAWDAYSKAKYLHYLRNNEQMDFGRLSDYCGGRRKEVQQYIDAYSDMEQYYRPLTTESDFDPKRFSSFVELQVSDRKKAISKAGYSVSDFAQWVVDGLFDKQEDVRHINKILANPKAKAIFLEEGSAKAKFHIELAGTAMDISNIDLVSLSGAIIRKIQGISFNEVQAFKKSPDSEEAQTIVEAYDELKRIVAEIESSKEA